MPAAKPRTYSLIWEEMAWCEGWSAKCDQTGIIANEEPFSTEDRALEFIERLENPEVVE